MLKSKLSYTKYPTIPFEEIDSYLEFALGVDKYELDPCLLCRLGAFSKYMKTVLGNKWTKIRITSGFRSTEKQKQIFFSLGGKYSESKGYYWDDSVPISKRKASKPNSSTHEFAIAIDSNTQWLNNMYNNTPTRLQVELLKFGIYKPYTEANRAEGKVGVEERWHYECIESWGKSVEEKRKLKPEVGNIIEHKSNKQIDAYEVLKSKSIISKIGFDWKTNCVKGNLISNVNVKALFNNFYKSATKEWSYTFTDVLDFMEKNKIFGDRKYWEIATSPTGAKADGQNVGYVIQNMAKYFNEER